MSHKCQPNYLQINDDIELVDNSISGVEILPLQEARANFEIIAKKFGSVFDYLDRVYPQKPVGGYLIWVKRNVKVDFPIQTCFYLTQENFGQFPHNLIYLEEGSEAEVVNLCGDCDLGVSGTHSGCTEIILEKSAKLKYTQIHSWNKNIKVIPMSGTMLESEAIFESNFISLDPVLKAKMCPTVILKGERSKATNRSYIYSDQNSDQDIGARMILEGQNAQAEIISKTICKSGQFVSRGILDSRSKNCQAHLECHGMLLSDQAKIQSIPELLSSDPSSELSHEASIGYLKRDKLEYLQTRGLSEQEAKEILIFQFLNLNEFNLPFNLDIMTDLKADFKTKFNLTNSLI